MGGSITNQQYFHACTGRFFSSRPSEMKCFVLGILTCKIGLATGSYSQVIAYQSPVTH